MKTNSFCKVGLSNNSVIALSVSILIFVSLSTGCSKKSVEVLSQSFYNVPESNVRLVPDSVALLVAEKFNPEIFFSNKSTAVNGHSVSTNSIGDKPIKKLDGNNKIKNRLVINDSAGVPAIYIYNFTEQKGFVCVSADSGMSPVLAYIEKGEYKDQDISWLNKKWVSKTLYNFGLVRKKLHDNKKIASIAWQNYFSNLISNNSISPERSGGYRTNPATPPTDPCTSDPDYYLFVNQTVSPLLTTNWGQGTSYNNLLTTCSPEIFPLVGGASVAMGQIMHYYQYPSSAYGHTYNYSAMPSASGNIYNQTLLTDIMNSIGARPCFDGDLASEGYNPNSYGHSGTSVHVTISNSFKSSFYYSYADDADYTIGTDYSNVTSNLFVNKPVLLIGYFDEDCTSGIFTVPLGVPHYWVCDGLNQSNITFCSSGSSTTEQILYFHMNFGDNEIDATTSFTRTGWYAFSDWTLPGYGGPTYYNEIVYNIHW